ncbi:MAG: phospholipase D family protein [Acetobacter orientalis]|uniref:phospholipase D-like domain-containing protein n=2 Tax=Acetobacter orientalis TaxID=146474 RepID=UPI0039EA58E5
MRKIYSNGPDDKDFVSKPFTKLMCNAKNLYLAAPYFTHTDYILEAVQKGKKIQLLIGLNEATSPKSLSEIFNNANIAIRYLTTRFHAKIFIFDNSALLGSSNLTDGGLISNREAVICLDQPQDYETVEEIRSLFHELWDCAEVLTQEKLNAFANAHGNIQKEYAFIQKSIEDAVGKAEPININIKSRSRTKERIFLQDLQRIVYEQYKSSFNEVTDILKRGNYSRPELSHIGLANETSRFLNYLRLTHIKSEEAWQTAPLRSPEERQKEIEFFGKKWILDTDNKVPSDYLSRLHIIQNIFGNPAKLQTATQQEITEGLMSLYAFEEQLRYVRGGAKNLASQFWEKNNNDLNHVKEVLSYFIFGSGNFIERLHDILYNKNKKLAYFGQFCALELFGAIKPDECPPITGRVARTLRFLGFDVKSS